MKWLVIYTVSIYLLWQATDLSSDSAFAGLLAPLALFFVVAAFVAWLSIKLNGGSSSSAGGAGGGFFGGGGDSGSGGGDGGGGC